MYNYRIRKYIGAYTAALGGLDILVFSGGVGENSDIVRRAVCCELGYMGIDIDLEKNKVRREEAVISSKKSKVKVLVVPTNEELVIASDTMEIINERMKKK